MRYSRIRTALLTFIIGLVSVPFFNPLYDKWREPSVDVPKVLSDSKIVVDLETENRRFALGGGGGSGGREDYGYGSFGREVPTKASLKSCWRKYK
jgi:hypothetical protein